MQLPAGVRASAPGGHGQQAAHRHAVDAQLLARAEVGQHEHADRVTAGAPAGASDPALPVEAHHAGARPHRTLDHPAGGGLRVGQRPSRVGRLHLHGARIVEPAVVALTHHRDNHLVDPYDRIGGDGRRHRAVVHPAHRHRRGQVDRCVERAPLGHFYRSSQLSGAVEHRHPGAPRRLAQAGRIARNDGGHAAAGHASAGRRLGLVAPHRDVSHAHPRDVRDRVGRPGLELTDADAVVAQASRGLHPAHPNRRVRSRGRGTRHARRLERSTPSARSRRRDLGGRAHGGDRGAGARGADSGRADRPGGGRRRRPLAARRRGAGRPRRRPGRLPATGLGGLGGGRSPRRPRAGSRGALSVRARRSAGRPPSAVRADRRHRTGRPVRIRHDDPDRAGHVGGRTRGSRHRGHRRRPRPRRRARRLRVLPAARAPRDPARVRRLVLPQQHGRRRGPPARSAAANGWR